MYFMYVDESGDTGLGAGSSDLFILSAIIVHEAFWTDVLNEMYRIRRGMHKQSELSLPIQFCDVNAYFLKQTIQPNSTVLKHKARNYFYYLDPILLKGANADDPHGIVRK